MNHKEAKALVDQLGLTPQESLALRAVSLHESNYGQGWKNPEHRKKNNMGAITTTARTPEGECLPADFEHEDSRREGEGGEGGNVTKYKTCFKGSATPLDGFKLLKHELFIKRPSVKEAAKHSLADVATAMRETTYYLGTAKTKPEQIADYTGALEKAVRSITASTGESYLWSPKAQGPAAATPSGSSSGSSGSSLGSATLPNLRPGVSGDAVQLFARHALTINTNYYSDALKQSVVAYQLSRGLKGDGIVGPRTWNAFLQQLWAQHGS